MAAEAIVEAALARENFAELHGRLGPAFGRVEPFRQAGKDIAGLMSDVPRKNGWTLAGHAGDRRPDAMQRLLNHASRDAFAAMTVIRRFVAERLCGGLAVMALDETGQEKKAANADVGISGLRGIQLHGPPRHCRRRWRWSRAWRQLLQPFCDTPLTCARPVK